MPSLISWFSASTYWSSGNQGTGPGSVEESDRHALDVFEDLLAGDPSRTPDPRPADHSCGLVQPGSDCADDDRGDEEGDRQFSAPGCCPALPEDSPARQVRRCHRAAAVEAITAMTMKMIRVR